MIILLIFKDLIISILSAGTWGGFGKRAFDSGGIYCLKRFQNAT
jgi:hypothetical protein